MANRPEVLDHLGPYMQRAPVAACCELSERVWSAYNDLCHVPVPATSDRQSAVRAERQRERRIGKMLVPEVFQPAGRRMTPSNVSPVVTKRQSAMSSLRANATIIVLRVPRRLSAVRARYHCASALCF